MRIIECNQGSPEWFAARCGIPTSSNFDKILTIEGDLSKQREKYLYQLAGERVTKTAEEPYQNSAMERGKALEDEARKFYEVLTKKTVKQVGFCVTEGATVYGASPDGLIGKDGLLEIKCPLMSTHVSYLLKGVLPPDYFQQTQGQLLVTGRKWVDFISYYPGLKPLLIRVKPHNQFISILKATMGIFCSDLDKLARRIKQ